jgi:flagellar basal body-associated protein FliL
LSKQSLQKANNGLSWRLLTVAVVVFFVAAGVYFLLESTRESKRLEQSLIDRFGFAEQYTPAANGSVPRQRSEAFLRVRQAVQTSCVDYQEVLNGIIGLADLETDA